MRPGRVIVADFSTLGRAIRRASAGSGVIGFDVFDTLVRRRVEPEAVKDRVAAELARRVTPGTDWRVVREHRTTLERDLYAERLGAGRDGEFTLAELVARWLAAVAPMADGEGAEALARDLIAYELELERRAQALTPGVADVLRDLAAAGHRLVFASDMYLPARDLHRLLDTLGIGRYFAAGYVSCDHGRRKTTGRLFELLLAQERIRPEELTFVGNSVHADVEPARRLGIAVVHVVDRHEHKRRLALEVAHWAAQTNPLWEGHLAQHIVETIPERVAAVRSPHYDLGLTVAPAFVSFILHVIEQTRALAVREVYFLAREGWLFLRLYRRLVTALGLADSLPRGRYLFASRLATFLPSLARLDWPELHRMWRQYDRQPLRLLLANLRLPVDEFGPLAHACGIADLDAPIVDPEGDVAFGRFLADPEVQRCFTAHRDAAWAELRAYLEQIAVPGPGTVAFVDVGWKGSIQANICRAFADDPAFPFVHGLYLGAMPLEEPIRGDVSGFLTDTRRPDALLETVFRVPTPFEMTATAPHGTVAGYDRPAHRGGRVVPILVEHAVELREAVGRREAQQAIADYLADFVRCRGLFEPRPEVLRLAAADRVLRYLRYPTRWETRVFADYAHSESFGVRGVTTFRRTNRFAGALRAGTPRRVWRELWRRVDAELWPELALRQAHVPLGQPLYDLRNALRRRP